LKILILNGPNINMLGTREKDIYGKESYEDLLIKIKKWSDELKVDTDFFQSNSEGDIIDKVQEANSMYEGIIINPGAYTHYSYAILDALKSIDIPSIEVHITNIYKREEFRKKSVTAEASIGIISGFSFYGYKLALEALVNLRKGSI